MMSRLLRQAFPVYGSTKLFPPIGFPRERFVLAGELIAGWRGRVVSQGI
jgi:hypothetical protein